MLTVTLDLRCNVCRSETFLLPTLDEASQDIRCARCAAFKCKNHDLERAMSAVQRRREMMASVA